MTKGTTMVTDPNGIEWIWVSHWCPTCYNTYPRDGHCTTCPRKSKLEKYRTPHWKIVGKDQMFEKEGDEDG